MNVKMKQNIKIHITHRFHQLDAEEKVELTVFGIFYRDEKNYYIRYKEKQPVGEIKTAMKFSEEDLLLLRRGAVNMRMHFLKNKRRSIAIIDSNAGEISFDSELVSYKESFDLERGLLNEVNFQYNLWNGDEQIGFYHIGMKVEEN